MNTEAAMARLSDVIRRKHFALSPGQSYCGWLKRYCAYVKKLPSHLSSEHKLERFLTALVREDVAASTQNQALNAILFFYQEALGVALKDVQALRARRPAQLLKVVPEQSDFATALAVRLLYGCGLRVPVTEAQSSRNSFGYFGFAIRRGRFHQLHLLVPVPVVQRGTRFQFLGQRRGKI
jgi:hypothetical protein